MTANKFLPAFMLAVLLMLPFGKAGAQTASDDMPQFYLRTNLLRWATLTPDVGFEWRLSQEWSVQFNATCTSWQWDNKNRRYALWEISPEVRYFIGSKRRAYAGAMFHAGEFNYKLSDTGKQGWLIGGGITGGYVLPIGKTLDLDFSLGIGCTHASYDRYTLIEGVRVRQGEASKNYWGINHLGVSLMWNI